MERDEFGFCGLSEFFGDESDEKSEYGVRFGRLSELLLIIIENELTDTEKKVIKMHHFKGKSISSTAYEMNVCPSTVSRTLSRAEKKIRKYMKYAFFIVNGSLSDNYKEF